MQMSDVNIFAIDHIEDKGSYLAIASTAKRLDRADFLPNGYSIDEERYPRIPLKDKSPKVKSKRKEKSPEEDDADDDSSEDEEETQEEEIEEDEETQNVGGSVMAADHVVNLDDYDDEDFASNLPHDSGTVSPIATESQEHDPWPVSDPPIQTPRVESPRRRPSSAPADVEVTPVSRRNKRKAADLQTRTSSQRPSTDSAASTLESVVKMFHDQNAMNAKLIQEEREAARKEREIARKEREQMWLQMEHNRLDMRDQQKEFMSSFMKDHMPMIVQGIVQNMTIHNPPAIAARHPDDMPPNLYITGSRQEQTSSGHTSNPSVPPSPLRTPLSSTSEQQQNLSAPGSTSRSTPDTVRRVPREGTHPTG